jgi:prolyl oligopeptidase
LPPSARRRPPSALRVKIVSTLLMSLPRPTYPPDRRADTVDTLHGVPVADPYRWLEDPDSVETRAWVEAQNAITAAVLDRPVRKLIVQRLWTLFDYPRTAVAIKRGRRYFVAHNTGLQNQPVLYVGASSAGPFRPLLDPNALSPDGTVALTAVSPDKQGNVLAYGLSQSGSDRQDILLLDVESGDALPDRILWTKFVSIAWIPDGRGFYYTRFPEPGSVADGDENYFCSVWYHELGRPQAEDVLIFDAPDQRETVFQVDVSEDGRWLVITALQGASDRSEVYLLDRSGPGATTVPLFQGFRSAYGFIEAVDGRLFFTTDEDAPRGRIITVDADRPQTRPATGDPRPATGNPRPAITEIVPESGDKLSAALIAGGRLVTAYLHNASDRVRLFDMTGRAQGEIVLPGIGSLTGLEGRPSDHELLIGFTSFTSPPANYRYDFTKGVLALLPPPIPSGSAAMSRGAGDSPEGRRHPPGFAAQDEYETQQVWVESRDGTPVSMFLVHRRDLPRDGRRPLLLTGYGGFNISLTPAYDPGNFTLLEAGGIYAVANLRGGGEYGESWHEAGMLDRKQNVFDDFIAVAEWLTENGYTSPAHLAIEGGSNGGLLTAAVMLQRPELFGAVVCRVPVVDMLRYHLFTVGRFWIPEYGSADDPGQFEWLLRYSPYHNVRDDVAYPPVLITTADTDDRVSPGMARKFAARLQAAAGNQSPVLIRIETKAGHGAGKPVAKMIEEDADIFTFVIEVLSSEGV